MGDGVGWRGYWVEWVLGGGMKIPGEGGVGLSGPGDGTSPRVLHDIQHDEYPV